RHQPEQRRSAGHRIPHPCRVHDLRAGRSLLTRTAVRGHRASTSFVPPHSRQGFTMKQVLGDKRAILTLVGPALIVYTVVMLVPVMWSLGYTFFDGNAITGFRFTGLDSFTRLWDDTKVHDAFVFTLKYAAVVTVGQVLIGYGLALLYVFVLRRYSATVRTLLFFPIVLPTVAV